MANSLGLILANRAVVLGAINTLSGSANVLYSKCAILKALEMTAVGSLMRSRSWVPLF